MEVAAAVAAVIVEQLLARPVVVYCNAPEFASQR